ncbi:MAG: Ig-like domain-containing protein, partial [Campylobacterota bacterium]|nr:Ig-like domain-containing protein [Campylobacterota bacterium]
VITSSPSHGSVSVTSSGIANYRPYANYYGNDSFAYTVKDTQGATSNVATVDILINDVYDPPPNQPPSANNDYAIYDNSANPPLYINVLANDTDINGNSDIDPSTVSIVATSGMATISVNPTTGIVSYTHNSYLTHPDTFEYTVKDYSGATSNPATVTVNYQ